MAAAYITEDHFLQNLTDRAVKCTICNEECNDNNKLASNACLDCKCYLCDICTENHNALEDAKDHQINSLNDLSIGSTPTRSQYHPSNFKECKAHFRPLDLFCEDDQVAVCYLCTYERSHEGHHIIPIITIADELRKGLKPPGLTEIKTKLQGTCDEITTALKSTLVSKETIVATIESQKEDMIAFITSCSDEIKNNIVKECEEHEKYLTNELEFRLRNLKSLSSLSDIVAQLDVMDTYKLVEIAKDVKYAYWPEAQAEVAHKIFSPHTGINVKDQMKSLLVQSMGAVSSNTRSRYSHMNLEDNAEARYHKVEESCSERKNERSTKYENTKKEYKPCSIDLNQRTDLNTLDKCKRTLHACIEECFSKMQPKCLNCGVLYGEIKGNQPIGQMNVTREASSLPGYENSGTIFITYIIPDGIQGANHPNPGKRYTGAIRYAFLPDNKEGNKVLALLDRAFKAKMIFTIGRSRTFGNDNCVVWNGIHHKTNRHAGAADYGYPDPEYLSRVQEELAAKGFK